MNWILAKLDSLTSALFAATFGLAASQLLEFIQQYRQRLGGHLAEAQLAFRATIENTTYRGLEATARQALAAPQQDRIVELAGASNALSGANAWFLPWKFFGHIDFSIAGATFKVFQPALPLDLVSLSYAAAGMVIGWAVWNLLKSLARPPRRKHRKQGA
ncbi:MAG: DUF2937 family protein [Alphaproteobacteria bacterium]|nr:DUF2937 family protein [Alphaproteobacteria bacterium]